MGEDARSKAASAIKAKRPFATRSRTGCISCKQSRIRCDELRPSCTNCVVRRKKCSYTPVIPLRDRRAQQAGAEGQAPWVIQASQPHPISSWAGKGSRSEKRRPEFGYFTVSGSRGCPRSDPVDPLAGLPIQMPYRSKELLYYFCQIEEVWGDVQDGKISNCLTSAVQSPFAMRNMLLIAGIHYACNVGKFKQFESAFLFHKLLSIQMVNRSLGITTDSDTCNDTCRANPSRNDSAKVQKSKVEHPETSKPKSGKPKAATKKPDNAEVEGFLDCVKQILTLCVTEFTLANFAGAQAHLVGLMTLIDHYRIKHRRDYDFDSSIEAQISDRFLILAALTNFSLKGHSEEFETTTQVPADTNITIKLEELQELPSIDDCDWLGAKSFSLRLRAISLLPFFFTPAPASTKLSGHIDIRTILSCIQHMTTHHAEPTGPHNTKGHDCSSPTQLLVAIADAHVGSISSKQGYQSSEKDVLLSSWASISVSVGMYMTSVLTLWSWNSPIDPRLHYHFLTILKRDLYLDLEYLGSKDKEAQALWLWKMVVGVLSIIHIQLETESKRLEGLSADFSNLIRKWSEVQGTEKRPVRWADCRKTLDSITWPKNFKREDKAERFWDDATIGIGGKI